MLGQPCVSGDLIEWYSTQRHCKLQIPPHRNRWLCQSILPLFKRKKENTSLHRNVGIYKLHIPENVYP